VKPLIEKSDKGSCPWAMVAHVTLKPQGHFLSFTMTNTTGRKLVIYKKHLPWESIYSVRIAALTTDGTLLDTGFAPIDNFDVEKIEWAQEQTLRGDYDLSWRWNQRSDPPTGFPSDKVIMLIWTYALSAEELEAPADAVCSGVTAFRSSN
jgi:hypothetical protein